MIKTVLKWTRRLAVLAALAALVARVLESTGQAGPQRAPVIGGDTWPPVPLNPNRTN